MKFYNYIHEKLKEDMHIDEINDLLQKDCKYYLNLIKNKYIFKRGMDGYDIFGKRKVRQDRKPRAMNKDYFKELNKWLQKNGHTRRDKSVIVTNLNEGKYSLFGKVYYVFPIGKFNYTWLMAKDINMRDDRTGWDSIATEEFFRFGDVNSINGEFKDYFVTNSSLNMAWKQQYETWFDCKEYYYFLAEQFHWMDGTLYLIRNQ